MILHPANPGFGIQFKRIDLPGQPIIKADCDLVTDTSRGTTLEDKGTKVSTVEHILAALVGMGIDNCLIDINGPEIPIMDGSSQPFVEIIEEAGIEEQEAAKHWYTIDTNITYLQVQYPGPDHVEKVRVMTELFPDEVIGHLEFIKFDGQIQCAGLPLVRYTTKERLEEIIRIHEENGCPIFNPHRYTLEEGGMKQTDAVQLAFKKEADPKGLLNPGKMIAWENPDFDFETSKPFLFKGLQQVG